MYFNRVTDFLKLYSIVEYPSKSTFMTHEIRWVFQEGPQLLKYKTH